MGKIIMGIIVLTGFVLPSYLTMKELGEYAEEINPYNADKDCNGCFGASFGDCEDCDELRRYV